MPANKSTTARTAILPEVLTLSEAADYLRTSEDALQRLATSERIPARKIGEEWRFFLPALQDWLRRSSTLEQLLAELERRLLARIASEEQALHKSTSKERMLAMAGVWKDDPFVEEMLQKIYEERGRPMTEETE